MPHPSGCAKRVVQGKPSTSGTRATNVASNSAAGTRETAARGRQNLCDSVRVSDLHVPCLSREREEGGAAKGHGVVEGKRL